MPNVPLLMIISWVLPLAFKLYSLFNLLQVYSHHATSTFTFTKAMLTSTINSVKKQWKRDLLPLKKSWKKQQANFVLTTTSLWQMCALLHKCIVQLGLGWILPLFQRSMKFGKDYVMLRLYIVHILIWNQTALILNHNFFSFCKISV